MVIGNGRMRPAERVVADCGHDAASLAVMSGDRTLTEGRLAQLQQRGVRLLIEVAPDRVRRGEVVDDRGAAEQRRSFESDADTSGNDVFELFTVL